MTAKSIGLLIKDLFETAKPNGIKLDMKDLEGPFPYSVSIRQQIWLQWVIVCYDLQIFKDQL